MQLRNHIAYRFLTDATFIDELMETCLPYEWGLMSQFDFEQLSDDVQSRIASLFDVADFKNQKAYYITNTVLDKLDMLNVAKPYDWKVFDHVPDCKLTFIFPHNGLLRVRFVKNVIAFLHIEFVYHPKEKQTKHDVGTAHFVNFFVDRMTGEQCDHFNHIDVKKIETMLYHLLCFFYLSENTERIVSPGKSYGTKKQPDALSNDLNVPVTIINSCWNITSIRTDGFDVRGHFRLQPYPSLNQTKMIFIEPFKKNGYIRKAINIEHI